MKRRFRKNNQTNNYLIGIPIIITITLVLFYNTYHKPEYEEVPVNTIIFSSDRYHNIGRQGWHRIDLSSFSIETPANYYFFFDEGIHGGRTGGLTNLKDTIDFVHGRYYFDACDGYIIGETIGKCDTLEVFYQGKRKITIAETGTYVSIYSKTNDDYTDVLKLWGRDKTNRPLYLEIFRTLKFRE